MARLRLRSRQWIVDDKGDIIIGEGRAEIDACRQRDGARKRDGLGGYPLDSCLRNDRSGDESKERASERAGHRSTSAPRLTQWPYHRGSLRKTRRVAPD